MGETKKRRQTKHRGNAAGMVEARGNTGARGGATGGSRTDSRGVRVPPMPSWNRAIVKALVPVLILAPFLFLTQKDTPTTGKIFFLILAFFLYIPMSYFIDRWAYQRYLKQRAS
ncbi:MAG: hypothetical protein J7513_04785 [Solirubrobacteraceae bacterium]|nr:hypothetical protein [Solirubrobacteraceae bacterium]